MAEIGTIGVIPNVYFDIIARVLPGCTLIAAVSWDRHWFKTMWHSPNVVSVSAFIAAGYLTAMLLYPFTRWECLARCKKIWIALGFGTFQKQMETCVGEKAIANQSEGVLLARISDKNPLWGIDIYKLTAEQRMCEILFVATCVYPFVRLCVLCGSAVVCPSFCSNFTFLAAMHFILWIIILRLLFCAKRARTTVREHQIRYYAEALNLLDK